MAMHASHQRLQLPSQPQTSESEPPHGRGLDSNEAAPLTLPPGPASQGTGARAEDVLATEYNKRKFFEILLTRESGQRVSSYQNETEQNPTNNAPLDG